MSPNLRNPLGRGRSQPATDEDLEADLRRPGGLMRAVRRRHPSLIDAITGDVRATLRYQTKTAPTDTTAQVLRQALLLAVRTDAFAALCCYRIKARLQHHGVPLLPHLFHRLAMVLGQVCIGDPVHVEPGLYVPHGQIVVDGFTEVGPDVVLSPFVTVGLRSGHPVGPTLGPGAYLGTGAKVFGPVTIGEGAKIGANAVVNRDVPAKATAVGVPASVHDPR